MAAFGAGLALGWRFNLSQICLLAPMLIVGVFYANGISGAPPREILYVAQIGLGAAVGARFDFKDIRLSARLGKTGILLVALHLSLAVAVAGLASFLWSILFWWHCWLWRREGRRNLSDGGIIKYPSRICGIGANQQINLNCYFGASNSPLYWPPANNNKIKTVVGLFWR